MLENKEAATAIDKGVYLIHGEEDMKTSSLEFTTSYNAEKNDVEDLKKSPKWYSTAVPLVVHYVTLTLLGLLIWGWLWCVWGDNWGWNGPWFRMAAVVAVAWGSGLFLQQCTTLPPLLAALLTGILARHLNILDMRYYAEIDGFLRKVYPVMILGKGSLAWDVNFMKSNWLRVAGLGAVPWTVEVVTLAVCTRYLLDYPWIWGFLLGSIYASVSCPVLMPTVLRIGANPGRTYNWPQLVCTAGGIDTALSVGVFGIIYSYIFSHGDLTYRYVKAGLTLFVGVAIGVTWGSLAKVIPYSKDYYVTELRVLFVVIGGLFINFFTLHLGWGGVGGVAVLACNATAATYWSKDNWKLNNNPASTTYRVLWSAFEPTVFAYTGTFIDLRKLNWSLMLAGVQILLICIIIRLVMAALMCWRMTLKERMFICCAWIPKSIVEAVLCPLALNTLILHGGHDKEQMQHAEILLLLIVQAIIITTPIGFLLTNHLGPVLLKNKTKDCENKCESKA